MKDAPDAPVLTGRLLAAGDVAALVQCSEDHAYALIKREMVHRKIGVLLRVSEEDFWAWFNSDKRAPHSSIAASGGAPRVVRPKVRPAPSAESAGEPLPTMQPRRPRRSAAPKRAKEK
jgi:hypothetical protein